MKELEKLKNILSEQQQEYYPAVKWLVNDGPRGSGRTFTLALAFVEKALETGHPVRYWDHYPYRNNSGHLDYLLDQISSIVHRLENYELVVNHSQQTIQITHKVDDRVYPRMNSKISFEL